MGVFPTLPDSFHFLQQKVAFYRVDYGHLDWSMQDDSPSRIIRISSQLFDIGHDVRKDNGRPRSFL